MYINIVLHGWSHIETRITQSGGLVGYEGPLFAGGAVVCGLAKIGNQGL